MNRRALAVLGVCVAAAHLRAATPIYISVDVPTTETATSTTMLASEIHSYVSSPAYGPVLSVAGSPVLDAIEKLDAPGRWLFSVESASDLGGALAGAVADPRDVIQLDAGAGTYGFFFCGALAGVPEGANLDALFLEGGDSGDLVASFDVPVDFGPITFEPADLVRFSRNGPNCGDWTLAPANPVFDASVAGTGVPPSVNLVGADQDGARLVLAFDVPVDLGPPGPVTYLPGQIVSWDGAIFAPYESLTGWPANSVVDGLSRGGNPGLVPPTLNLAKTAAPQLNGSDLILTWSASCSSGAEDYGVYEGTLGVWYSHSGLACSDTGAPLTQIVTPTIGNRYYLVVAQSGGAEGSFGKSRNHPAGSATERPQGAIQCETVRLLTACP